MAIIDVPGSLPRVTSIGIASGITNIIRLNWLTRLTRMTMILGKSVKYGKIVKQLGRIKMITC